MDKQHARRQDQTSNTPRNEHKCIVSVYMKFLDCATDLKQTFDGPACDELGQDCIPFPPELEDRVNRILMMVKHTGQLIDGYTQDLSYRETAKAFFKVVEMLGELRIGDQDLFQDKQSKMIVQDSRLRELYKLAKNRDDREVSCAQARQAIASSIIERYTLALPSSPRFDPEPGQTASSNDQLSIVESTSRVVPSTASSGDQLNKTPSRPANRESSFVTPQQQPQRFNQGSAGSSPSTTYQTSAPGTRGMSAIRQTALARSSQGTPSRSSTRTQRGYGSALQAYRRAWTKHGNSDSYDLWCFCEDPRLAVTKRAQADSIRPGELYHSCYKWKPNTPVAQQQTCGLYIWDKDLAHVEKL